jgi:aminoglycoside 3-N-acetyltransferase
VTSADREAAIVAATPVPRTRASLATDLRALGVRPGEVLLAHSSLSALGWTVGGEIAVVQALLDVLGPDGTLVVPTQTGGNSDPRHWRSPPVPEQWWPAIRAAMPGYDPAVTPPRGMGAVAEGVRRWPGAVRSGHPQFSFAAVGAAAARLMAVHDLESPFGERSPLAALEAAGARVLLAGVGYGSCTALHLAETRVPGAPAEVNECAVTTAGGGREWISYPATVAVADDFGQLGEAFEAGFPVVAGALGSARARLVPLEAIVAFGTRWIAGHRTQTIAGGRPRWWAGPT